MVTPGHGIAFSAGGVGKVGGGGNVCLCIDGMRW